MGDRSVTSVFVIPGQAPEARPGMTTEGHIVSHLNPVPLQRWHLTTLSPFLTRPLPSQFLHFCFFLTLGPFSLAMIFAPHRRTRERVDQRTAHVLARRRQERNHQQCRPDSALNSRAKNYLQG
jgi:hypothetical protein